VDVTANLYGARVSFDVDNISNSYLFLQIASAHIAPIVKGEHSAGEHPAQEHEQEDGRGMGGWDQWAW